MYRLVRDWRVCHQSPDQYLLKLGHTQNKFRGTSASSNQNFLNYLLYGLCKPEEENAGSLLYVQFKQ